MTLRHLTKVGGLVLAMSVMASFSLWALVQEIDYTTEQYEAYNKCPGLTDPDAKQQCILDFIDEHPKLSLVEYAIAEYGQALQEQIQKGQHEQVVTAGEAMLKYRPNEIKLITQLCYSAYNSGQYEKAAKYGELAYVSNPAGGFIQILTDAYQKTGNKQKYSEWALKAIDALEPSQSFQFVEEIRASAARAENWGQAARYARKTLDFLSKMERTPNASEAEWNSWVRKQRAISYLLLGRNAYEGQNWARAVVNYQRVIRNARDRNLRGEAHYYIGMSNWKESRLQPAMAAFACGAAQRGSPHAGACDGYLIRLYKSTHNDSTAGLEEFKKRVKGDCS